MFVDHLAAILRGVKLTRYASVGLSGFLFDNTALVVFVEAVHLDPITAKLIAAELSIVLMFLINEYWTFAEYGMDTPWAVLERLVRSNAVRLGGLVVSVVVLYGLHVEAGMWYVAANVVGIAVGFLVTFVMETAFIWRVVGE